MRSAAIGDEPARVHRRKIVAAVGVAPAPKLAVQQGKALRRPASGCHGVNERANRGPPNGLEGK